VYSGDVDMCLPFTGTEAWTSSLELPLLRPWRQWHVKGQVAGFNVRFEGLDYVTVRGAGHMVAELKPSEALHMFGTWLEDKAL
jgi:serine carboxypeptidase-like clade 1